MHETNLTDHEFLAGLINEHRSENQYVIPIYVKIFDEKFPILDLDQIKSKIAKSSFKVGFGTCSSVLTKSNNFPTEKLYNFNVEETFVMPAYEYDIDYNFFIIEESYTDISNMEPGLVYSIYEEMNKWIDLLYPKCEAIANEYIKQTTAYIMGIDADQGNDVTTIDDEVIPTKTEYSDDDIDDDEDEYFGD